MPKPPQIELRHAGWIAATKYAQEHLTRRREHAAFMSRLTGDKGYDLLLRELEYISKHLQSVCDAIVKED